MKPRIVVIGAGYAGLIAANRLAVAPGRDRPDVVLVTADPGHVQRVRLHEALARGRDVVRPLSRVLHPDVEVVVARADGVDTDASTVVLANGRRIGFDRLVIATGSIDDPVPDAMPVGTAAGVRAARAALAGVGPHETVAVLGGGLTGIETATALAAVGRRVRLVTTGRIAPGASERGAAVFRSELDRAGIELVEHASPADSTDAVVRLSCTGFRASPFAADSGFEVDGRGRVPVDADLHAPGAPHVLVAGDAATYPGGTLRMSCATGMPLGAHAADVVLAELRGVAPTPFRYASVVRCTSTGPGRGVVELLHPDDSPRGPVITGRAGGIIKACIMKIPEIGIPTQRRRWGAYRWPTAERSAPVTT